MIGLQINDQPALEALARIRAQVASPADLAAILGRRGSNELRSWFARRDVEDPSKLGSAPGGERQHFWLRVRDSVQSPRISDGGGLITININDPAIAQKVFGGPITPKVAGALTLAIDPLAYGRTASVFEHETGIRLFLYVSRTTELAYLASTSGDRHGEQQLHVYYLLSPGVNQMPDPKALPPEEQFAAAIVETAQDYFDQTNARRGRNEPL